MDEHRKNSKTPAVALVENGSLRCPKCGRLLGKAYYKAKAKGIELWCGGKGCHMPVLIEL